MCWSIDFLRSIVELLSNYKIFEVKYYRHGQVSLEPTKLLFPFTDLSHLDREPDDRFSQDRA